MGIGLQSWERHGWSGSPAEVYWFWRDRKGLFGNPLSLFTNFLFVYGVLTWLAARVTDVPWGLARHALHTNFLLITLVMQIIQSSIRMVCTGRLYGIIFALGVPLRALCANWINTVATLRAISGYLRSRIRHEPLVWLKTEHAYPSRNALMEHKRKLGEILVGSADLDEGVLMQALAAQPTGLRIGEYLVKLGDDFARRSLRSLELAAEPPLRTPGAAGDQHQGRARVAEARGSRLASASFPDRGRQYVSGESRDTDRRTEPDRQWVHPPRAEVSPGDAVEFSGAGRQPAVGTE
jgi:hypothetical protein